MAPFMGRADKERLHHDTFTHEFAPQVARTHSAPPANGAACRAVGQGGAAIADESGDTAPLSSLVAESVRRRGKLPHSLCHVWPHALYERAESVREGAPRPRRARAGQERRLAP